MAIHKDFASLGRSLHKTANGVVANTEAAVRRATVAAYTALVIVTPVDTGRARAGWIISFNSPVPSAEIASKSGQSIGIAKFKSQALSTIKAWNITKGSLFISNSVEYINFLEDGHSSQRPEGMLVHGVSAAEAVLRTAKLLD